MSDPANRNANPSFARAFLPGLVVGLIVGLALGAIVPTLLESPGSLTSDKAAMPPPSRDTPRDVRPDEPATPGTVDPAPADPAAAPAPETKPEETPAQPAAPGA